MTGWQQKWDVERRDKYNGYRPNESVSGTDAHGWGKGCVIWCCNGPRISVADEERVDENLAVTECDCEERNG